jgi:hypothetical protein
MDQPRGAQFLVSAISISDPLGFFLWGFVKDKVYILAMPTTLNNIKH